MACAVPPPIPFSRPLPPPVSTPSLRNDDTNVSLSEDATDAPTTEGTLGPYETELLRRASKCRERAERYYWYARFLCFESDGKVMVAALPGHFDTGDFNVLREGQLEVHIKDGMFDPDTSRIVWDGQGEQWTETMSCRELEQTILFVEQPKLANTICVMRSIWVTFVTSDISWHVSTA